MSDSLEPLPPVTPLSDHVTRVLGLNPGKYTLQGTNTYLVGKGEKRILIDTGEGIPEYLPLLKSALHQDGKAPIQIHHVIITHHHHDHVGGIQDVKELSGPGLKISKFLDSSENPDEYEPLRDGEVVAIDGATLRVIHTPGHTLDHLCLYLEEEQAIFSADCILGQGTAVFENLKSYLSSLEKLLPFHPKRIYPGHGPVIQEGEAKIREYISHRYARENQIVEYLKAQKAEPRTAMQMVKEIYASYPEALHEPAKGSVLLHLGKLEEDGRVRRISQRGKGDQEEEEEEEDAFVLLEGAASKI